MDIPTVDNKDVLEQLDKIISDGVESTEEMD
jgi:hypothetical protein